MQIPILNGIYTNENSDFRTSYPRNLIPVPKESGISLGYLRPTEGIVSLASSSPGICRGSIVWNGVNYRVMGRKLCSVSSAGVVTEIGDVGTDNKPVSMDYSFDRLAIASNKELYYYDGTSLVKVTDTDLGDALDVIWVDGYFMTTDGTSLVITELLDPTQVDPLKYGSSEVDPDPIKAIKKIQNEPYAINRYTVEAFDNVGGSGFVFRRIDGAQVQKGSLGIHTCCNFLEGIALLGSGRNESLSIWFIMAGSSTKFSTKEVDEILQSYSESSLENVVIESRIDKNHEFLYIHLPDKTLVYDNQASQALKVPVWHILTSTIIGDGIYKARYFSWCYDKWIVGHPSNSSLGYFDNSIGSHWGSMIGWDFLTQIIYNEGNGALFHELELVALTGRAASGDNPTIWMSYSLNGELFSPEIPLKCGTQGQRDKRLVWLNAGGMQHWRLQKFRGTSDARLSIARLEARLEGLVF